jgi:hypothetical protein
MGVCVSPCAPFPIPIPLYSTHIRVPAQAASPSPCFLFSSQNAGLLAVTHESSTAPRDYPRELREMLYHEAIGLPIAEKSVYVVSRVRPFSVLEKKNKVKNCVEMRGNQTIVWDLATGTGQGYGLDAAFWSHSKYGGSKFATQEDVTAPLSRFVVGNIASGIFQFFFSWLAITCRNGMKHQSISECLNHSPARSLCIFTCVFFSMCRPQHDADDDGTRRHREIVHLVRRRKRRSEQRRSPENRQVSILHPFLS